MSFQVPDKWTFKDRGVAQHFDAHVREQLPWYEWATRAVAFLARQYIQPGTRVYDLGCSTGNIGRAIKDTLDERNAIFYPVDESSEMLAVYDGPGEPNLLKIENIEPRRHALAIAFLAFQFIPPETREDTLFRFINAQIPGGALILVDKFLPDGTDPEADSAIYRLTLDAKLRAGAEPEQIVKKELSLLGTQRALNRQLFRGYRATSFFQYGQFEGWIITNR